MRTSDARCVVTSKVIRAAVADLYRAGCIETKDASEVFMNAVASILAACDELDAAADEIAGEGPTVNEAFEFLRAMDAELDRSHDMHIVRWQDRWHKPFAFDGATWGEAITKAMHESRAAKEATR